MIMNKMSMVSLNFFVTIDLYFDKAKFLYENLSAILDGLSVLILLGNFFWFWPIIKQFLWKVPINSYKKHRQHIWHYFTNVIMLTKQMCQQDHIVFQQLLKRAYISHLTQKNVNLLNSKVSKELFISNNLFLVIVIQTNIKRHLINWHQIYKMARKKSQNIYIFPIFHTWLKIRGENFVLGKSYFMCKMEAQLLDQDYCIISKAYSRI